MEAGRVKDVIINADKGTIDFVTVDNGVQTLSAGVISTSDIVGIGEYALTIENIGVISDIDKVPEAVGLAQRGVKIKNTKVLTRKGRLIGSTGDFFVDEDKGCVIIGLEFLAGDDQERIKIIQRKSVITFGKNLIIVNDDVESLLLDNPINLESSMADADLHRSSYDAARPSADKDGNQTAAVSSENVSNTDEKANVVGLFEQKQRQYLKGRKASKTITDGFGNVIISEGMVITDEIIDEAKNKGKLIELIMNNKV